MQDLTSNEMKLAAPVIMKYLKAGKIEEKPKLFIIADQTNMNNIPKHLLNFVIIDRIRLRDDLVESMKEQAYDRIKAMIEFCVFIILDLAVLEKRNIIIKYSVFTECDLFAKSSAEAQGYEIITENFLFFFNWNEKNMTDTFSAMDEDKAVLKLRGRFDLTGISDELIKNYLFII